jgi:uncharacterized protein YcbX
MPGSIAALYRHPVKGFTPEALPGALLEAGGAFPCDRLFAVENGPSGFDPTQPAFLNKRKFTVLAAIPALAQARTAYDAASGLLSASAPGHGAVRADMRTETGRARFAAWLEGFIDPEDRAGPLRVLEGPGAHRFMDDAAGAVSLLNLASVRDLERRLGRPVDPLRFRANVHVEGWPAWAELGLAPGAQVRLGGVEARVVKPIVRCAATHVDPTAGTRDLDLVPSLYAAYGHRYCGLYLQVIWGGEVAVGDDAGADFVPSAPAQPVPDPRRPEIEAP